MHVLVVDDHVLIRDALRGVLNELRPDAVVLQAADCRQATRLLGDYPGLELILLDLGLPDADGFAMLKDLRDHYPSLAVVVLSALQDRDSVTRALDLGAVGFIPKSAQRAVMLSALQLVFAGGIYVPPEILRRGDSSAGQISPAIRNGQPRSPSDLGLTERQMEVLSLLLRGKSNKAIGRALDLAETTVKNHVTAILRALRVANRAEAIVTINQLGWDLPKMEP
jgi:DNA-binding NarL/FixJ family response regulator